jgi:hypothetical protein
MAKLGMWSLWGCAACVEKELNEGTCLFVNFILPARRRPWSSRVKFRNLSISTLHTCMHMHAWKKKMMVGGFGAPHPPKPRRKSDSSQRINHDDVVLYMNWCVEKKRAARKGICLRKGCHGTGSQVVAHVSSFCGRILPKVARGCFATAPIVRSREETSM